MRCHARWLSLAVVALLSACSGGGATTATTIPQANSTINAPSGNTRSVQLGIQPISATLPVVSQITGTLLFPAVRTPTTISLSGSATAPAGVALESVRRAQSGTLTVYAYVTIASAVTTSLPSLPAMTLHFPVTTPLAGKSVYYGISDLNAQGGLVSFNTQGPGTIAGQTVSFAQVPTPITYEAGHKYTFVIYATAAATQFLYVANYASNSITAYALPAQGNVAPTRTISGPATGLARPRAIAACPNGNVAVANQGGTVEVFRDGANGNVRPLTRFSLSSANVSLSSIACDPFNADIYVGSTTYANSPAGGIGIGAVSVFSPSGSLLRSMSLNSSSDVLEVLPMELAVDNRDELIAGVQPEFRDICDDEIDVFASNASGNVKPIGKKFQGSCGEGIAIAYARTTDHVFALSGSPTNRAPALHEYESGSFTTVRALDNIDFANSSSVIAVDPSGQNVYAVEFGKSIYQITDDPGSTTGFVQTPPITGPNTGLSQASGLAIGNP